MTGLEGVILALAAAAVVVRHARIGPDVVLMAVVAALLVLFAVRFAINPARWQMLPACLVAAALAATMLTGMETSGLARHAGLIVALPLLALSAALAVGFPVRALPAPSGAYAVGIVSHPLARPVKDGAARRLLVKVWYPATPVTLEDTRETLWSELHEDVEAPRPVRLLTSYLREVKTHGHRAAPIAKGGAPYPILIYNHALVSIASDNTLLMERLASEGFIVISIRHRDQLAEHREIQRGLSHDERARDRVLQTELARSTGRAERARLSAELYRASTGMPIVIERRAQDARHAVDRIDSVLAAIPEYDSRTDANTQHYGALGLSLGGAVATWLCASDPRCAAVANLDGGLFGFADRVAVPYLMLYSEQNAGSNDQLLDVLGSRYEEHVFADAKHLDFHDAAVAAAGLRLFGVLGPAGKVVNWRKNEAVAAFFVRQFMGTR